MKKKLPIGIQSFREIREDNCYYVDKTPYALQMIEQGKYYFLSRPRRFGKSLFLDTLKELFEGSEPLFRGLHAHDRWDWSRRYPVIRISFGGGVVRSRAELEASLHQQLTLHEERFSLPAAFPDIRSRFIELLRRTAEKHGERVVVLVDEYDKPILDRLEEPDIAKENRECLRDFYSVIKDADAHIKFALLAGVSKFTKVSLFSGLNNLNDITIDPAYSAICGYTDYDVDTVFTPELAGLDRDELRRWYNGYNWTGEAVYNPFDLLLLFEKRQFRPWWFETGTPTFLVQHLLEKHYFTPNLARTQSSMTLLSSFDVGQISPEALLFQTGYLTIQNVSQPILGQWVYTLGYPNLEVEASLNTALLNGLGAEEQTSFPQRLRLLEILQTNELQAMQSLFHSFYASIPHDWYRRNQLANYEGYYASIFYSYFAALGLDITLEDTTSKGRIDMAVRFNGHIWLFEFKVVEMEPKGNALQQLQDKGYVDKYRQYNEPIHLIGVEFSSESRNIVCFETAEAV
ncbi:MAG: hypothetical protein FIA89_11620 [Geobacter sp.]|nr:hypothetical protein [Geobacter sp.]